MNANVADAGAWVIEEHTEVEDSQTRHEELYLVVRGRARFTVDGEEAEAPAGRFVYIRDPAARRAAQALEDGTVVLAIGGEPGAAFQVSPWERAYLA